MKKYSLWLVVVLLVLGLAGYKATKEALKERPVEKSVSFTIYKGFDYTSHVYDCTFAQIHISVEKVRGNKRTTVWDTTFDAKLLKQYPSIGKALTENITIPQIVDKKEHLDINYIITYNSKGSELKMRGGTMGLVDPGKLYISI
jgi:hypothetical protein